MSKWAETDGFSVKIVWILILTSGMRFNENKIPRGINTLFEELLHWMSSMVRAVPVCPPPTRPLTPVVVTM